MDGLMLCSDTAKDDFKGPSINGWLMVVAYHSVLSFSQPLDGKVRSGINTQISFMGDPQLQHTTIFLAQSNVQYAIAQVMMWLSLVTVGQKVTTCSGFHAVFRIAMAMGQ